MSRDTSGNPRSQRSSNHTSARERSGASSRRSHDPNNNVSSAGRGARSGQNSASADKFRIPDFKARLKDTQKVDPDSNMYNEERLGFSRVSRLHFNLCSNYERRYSCLRINFFCCLLKLLLDQH